MNKLLNSIYNRPKSGKLNEIHPLLRDISKTLK